MEEGNLESDPPKKGASEPQRLIEGVKNKDVRAFESFYDLYSPILFSVIYKILMNREEAEEVLQEVFQTVWTKADQYRSDRSSPLTWITAIARNAAIGKLRSSDYKNRSRTGEFRDSFMGSSESAEEGAFSRILDESLRKTVREILSSLSPEIVLLLEEAYWSGLSQNEIAQKHGIPLGTVKSRIRVGLAELRHRLKGWNV
ncbi:sigma-70 family RNA polymerase sigma factor [Leptospira ellisii]|uniref:Sigma-70 family RNA polymerase sigma factor n=1 Tax=Leptospira ellisii TaxID=2023197 RepID=A0AAE4QRX4_9LEPT|nr:sigma-70 family RNA polymerase sigma factor [Leptospira ellisii]MDV6237450.1 sigma-70 family RNA polymerase sigma factor [Leptospira ellisii]